MNSQFGIAFVGIILCCGALFVWSGPFAAATALGAMLFLMGLAAAVMEGLRKLTVR